MLWCASIRYYTLVNAHGRLRNTLFLFILSHSFLLIGVTSSFVRALKSSVAALALRYFCATKRSSWLMDDYEYTPFSFIRLDTWGQKYSKLEA